MTPVLRVAAAQATSVPGDLAANVATAVDLVGSAADRGARVVVLPELFLTGYAPETWRLDQAVTTEDERLQPLREAAGTHRVVVVVGAAVRRSEATATLSALVVDSDGTVDVPYDKQHLLDLEREFFVAGDHGASLSVDGWELGLGVCYDGCFPEHAMAAAQDGAHAYLCPAAYVAGSEHRRDLYYAARALDNGMYVVLAGLTGPCGQLNLSGGSAVYDPEGRPIDRVGEESPALVVADLEAAEVARVRAANPLAADRLGTLGTRQRRVSGATAARFALTDGAP